MKSLIRKILKENEWDWMEEASNTISGEELGDFINKENGLTQIPDHIKHVEGNLSLYNTQIEDLGNLESVGGNLDLEGAKIKSLGNLQSVGGWLNLYKAKIEDLGNLETVGGNLNLYKTQISKKYTEQEIRNMVNVGGDLIYR